MRSFPTSLPDPTVRRLTFDRTITVRKNEQRTKITGEIRMTQTVRVAL